MAYWVLGRALGSLNIKIIELNTDILIIISMDELGLIGYQNNSTTSLEQSIDHIPIYNYYYEILD